MRNAWLGALVLVLLELTPVAGQQTATLIGAVRDPQGDALPGTAVQVEPVDGTPGVPFDVTTGSAGMYEVPALPQGEYRLRFAHPGFATVIQNGVRLRVATTTRVDATLALAGVREDVTVVATPVVDVSSVRVQTTVDVDLAAALPTSRNPWVVAGMVPGVVTGRLDVGGTEAVQQYAIEAFGSADSQKAFAVDGLKTNLPVSTGGLTFQYYDFDAYESFNFQVSAGSAENDVGGVFINMVTRSGTNVYSGRVSSMYAGGALQGSNVDERLRNRLGLVPGQITQAAGHPLDLSFDAGATLGGPVRRNRLWFFGAARWWRYDQFQTGAANPDGTPAIDDNQLRNFVGKLSANPGRGWRSAGSYTLSLKDRFHRRDPPFLIAEDRATARQESVTHNIIGRLDRAFTRAFVEVFGGRVWGASPSRYQPDVTTSDVALRDVVRLTRVHASDTVFALPVHRNQVDATLTVLHQGRLGAHEAKGGVRITRERAGVHWDRNGDMVLELRDGVPFQAQLANTPVRAEHRIDTWAGFIQDRWVAGRASINAGVRFDGVEGWLPDQTSPAGAFAAERQFARRDGVPRWPLSIAPRLGVAYDPTGRGRTALKVYAGRFYNQIGSDILAAVNPNALALAAVTWRDDNRNLRAEANELGPFTGFAGGISTRSDPDARRPYNDEFSAGIDHTLPGDTALNVAYHRRHHRDGLGIIDLARPPSAYSPAARSYVDPDTGATASVAVWDLDPALRAVRDRVLTTVPALRSTYNGMHAQVSKWLTARWQGMAGVTIQRHRGFLHDGTFTSADFNNPNVVFHRDGAAVFTDVPWILKGAATWVLPAEWRLSATYTGRGGEAIPRLAVFGNLVQSSETVHLAPRGTDRTEAVTRLVDLRGSKRVRLGGIAAEVSLDLFNALNANHVVVQNTVIGSTFGRPQLILGPRLAHVGVSVEW